MGVQGPTRWGWLSQKRKPRRLQRMRPQMHVIYALTRQGKATKGAEKGGETRFSCGHPISCGFSVFTQAILPRQFLILYSTMLLKSYLEDHTGTLLPNIAHLLLCTVCQLHLPHPSVERNHHKTTAVADQILEWWTVLNTTVTMTWWWCV